MQYRQYVGTKGKADPDFNWKMNGMASMRNLCLMFVKRENQMLACKSSIKQINDSQGIFLIESCDRTTLQLGISTSIIVQLENFAGRTKTYITLLYVTYLMVFIFYSKAQELYRQVSTFACGKT